MPITALNITIAISALLLSSTATALNMDFLALDPLRFFTEEDYELSEKTAIEALNNNADGSSSSWENPQSGNSGTITPLTTFNNEQGETCRKVTIADRTPGLSGEDTVHVCKGSDERWRFIDHAQTAPQ